MRKVGIFETSEEIVNYYIIFEILKHRRKNSTGQGVKKLKISCNIDETVNYFEHSAGSWDCMCAFLGPNNHIPRNSHLNRPHTWLSQSYALENVHVSLTYEGYEF